MCAVCRRGSSGGAGDGARDFVIERERERERDAELERPRRQVSPREVNVVNVAGQRVAT